MDATRDLMLKTLVAGNAEGVHAEPLWRMMASANHKCPEGQRNPRQDECLDAVKQASDNDVSADKTTKETHVREGEDAELLLEVRRQVEEAVRAFL